MIATPHADYGSEKVIILNGSPKANGNTATALHEVEQVLQQQGIETEWIHVGHLQIHGCIACNQCWKTGICAFHDIVNELSEKMKMIKHKNLFSI